jgi:hypothetical protein
MKNKIVTLAVAAFASVVLLNSCSGSQTAVAVNGQNFANISNDEKSLNSLLVFDMTSSLPLMNSSSLSVASLVKMLNGAETAPSAADDITSVLSSIDLLLTNGLDFKIEDVKSTNANYTYQKDVTYSLLDGTSSQYSLFYNSLKEETEIDEDEKETKVAIDGMALLEKEELSFSLVSETETGPEESESEVFFLFKKDEKNFVEVKNSSELEENEKEVKYAYRKVTDGVEETAYKLSFENEEGKEEVKLVQGSKVYKISTEIKDSLTLLHVKTENKDNGEVTNAVYQRIVEEKDGKSTVSYILYTA